MPGVSLAERLKDNSPSFIYSDGFRQMIEDHLQYLTTHPETDRIDISDRVAHKCHGDLIGVLQEYDIPRYLHWIIMRVNQMTSPTEYTTDRVMLWVPSRDVIDRLIKRYRVAQSIST